MTAPDHDSTPPPRGGIPARPASDSPRTTLGVFAKHWTPGTTKTRLAASIGHDAAAAVSRSFVETLLERLGSVKADAHCLAFAPAEQAAAFAALTAVSQGPWHTVPQVNGSLGERMAAFFDRSTGATLLVGSDSPDLPLNAVREAMAWLEAYPSDKGRLVLGPTSDGGYWLIGLNGAVPPIFEQMPWSETSLLEATQQRLAEAGWAEGTDYRLIEPWYDVDVADDLARLRQGLRGDEPALVRLADQLDALLGPAL